MREWEIDFDTLLADSIRAQEIRGTWLGKFYDRREYKSTFGWAPPDRTRVDELDMPAHGCVLQIDGRSTGWAYYANQADGLFTVFDDTWSITVKSREDAERLTILAYDRSNGPFDRERGMDREVYSDSRSLQEQISRPSRRFVTTREIPEAYLGVGSHPTNSYFGSSRINEHVHERVSLPEGTEILVTPAGWFAEHEGVVAKISFDPPEEARLTGSSGTERFLAFPTSFVRELPNGREEVDRFFDKPRREQRQYPFKAPRIMDAFTRIQYDREADARKHDDPELER